MSCELRNVGHGLSIVGYVRKEMLDACKNSMHAISLTVVPTPLRTGSWRPIFCKVGYGGVDGDWDGGGELHDESCGTEFGARDSCSPCEEITRTAME